MRFAVSDGPGIRTTVFLKGCPLRCAWCHNPESQAPGKEVMFARDSCIACAECVKRCPHNALEWGGGEPLRDARRCQLCGECCDSCVAEARRYVGYETTVSELLARILRDRIVFEESGGGVTFSGGEPLMQSEFLYAMLASCQAEGIHTAIDTCGSAPSDVFAKACELADLLLFDIKLMDSDEHRIHTGAANGVILDNLRFAMAAKIPLVARIPVVPGVNDSRQNLEATAELLVRNGVRSVDLLPYHLTGHEKYRLLGASASDCFVSPTETHMHKLREHFASRGFLVRIGG